MVQDTSWEGYEDVPLHIMQGYTTMGYEIVQQLQGVRPTHVFLQAGVGAMAGAVAAFLADYYKADKPIITIVEPEKADCIFKTAKADDGRLHNVTGALDSIMAGLCCGEPCSLAWDMLRRYADNFASMPDEFAAYGMRVLGNPLSGDTAIVSGESGAAGLGFALLGRSDAHANSLLQLDESSVVLCISTEGDTAPAKYRSIARISMPFAVGTLNSKPRTLSSKRPVRIDPARASARNVRSANEYIPAVSMRAAVIQ